jgi:hypothetical protein
MIKHLFPVISLVFLVIGAITDRASATYCHNDPVNKVDVLGLAEVVVSTPGGNDVLVNDETSFWLVYNMMADAGLVGKLDPFGGKPTFTDAMVVAGKLGGTVKNYPKAWPWAATGAASPNDLWIMPGSASLPGNPGGNFDSGIIGMQANHLASGKGFYLDAVDARGIQAAGEATSSFPWGTLSDREAQILGDRGGVLTWWDTPLLTVGGGSGRDEYQWGGGWSQWQPAPGPRGLGYAMGTTPWGTPRMVGNMLVVEVASAGFVKGLGAFRAFANTPLSINPNSIRFSQASVNGVEDITGNMMTSGWRGGPIDVVRMGDGGLTAFDNTRVLAASRAGINTQAVVHGAGEAFPVGRWIPKSGIAPETWSEAVLLRIQQQNRIFRQTYPNGAPITGSMR